MTTRHPELQAFLDWFADRVGIAEPTARLLDKGASHPYNCRCDVCLEWWAAVGPEPLAGGGYGYGPFSEAEIEAFKQQE